VAALANAAVVVVGVLLGLAGDITAGTLVAFLFLVTLFVAPVQTASEVLNEAQNAVAGFRRVLDVIDTAPDVRDPAVADPRRAGSCRGPLGCASSTSPSATPPARPALEA
jgi:putative ABC transport system ATP-binding protein